MKGKFTASYNRFADGRQAWMFQASDEAGWNFERLLSTSPSTSLERGSRMCGDGWVRSASSRKRIREEFQPGHLMFLYQADPEKEVVGLARLSSPSYERRRNGAFLGKGTFFDLGWWMRTAPLPYAAFTANPILAGMEKVRLAQGTISRVSEAEAGRLLEMLNLDAGQRVQVKREWRFPAQSTQEVPKQGGRSVQPPGTGRDSGREDDPEVRRAIEDHSMRLAHEHYEALGYEVMDTSATDPFDLQCRRGPEEVRVEVKGTRGDGTSVELTSGEVKTARGKQWRTDLFIVSGVALEWVSRKPFASGGKVRKLEAWSPAEDHLSPTRFRYTPPSPRPG